MSQNIRHDELTEKIIGAAIEVHKALGPGLLESTYEVCLCRELDLRGIKFRRQVALPVKYKGVNLDAGYRLDIVVEDRVVLELKSVESLKEIHEAQLITYLKLSGYTVGLLLNFNVIYLKRAMKRIVNNFDDATIMKRKR